MLANLASKGALMFVAASVDFGAIALPNEAAADSCGTPAALTKAETLAAAATTSVAPAYVKESADWQRARGVGAVESAGEKKYGAAVETTATDCWYILGKATAADPVTCCCCWHRGTLVAVSQDMVAKPIAAEAKGALPAVRVLHAKTRWGTTAESSEKPAAVALGATPVSAYDGATLETTLTKSAVAPRANERPPVTIVFPQISSVPTPREAPPPSAAFDEKYSAA